MCYHLHGNKKEQERHLLTNSLSYANLPKAKKMRHITNCSYMGVRYEHVLLCVILEIARGF